VRSQLPIALFDELVAWIHATPKVYRNLFPALSTDNPALLQRYGAAKALTLLRELRWAASCLAYHGDALSDFVARSSQLPALVLESRHAERRRLLDDIERQFGQSFWLIKNRIALLQESEGLEAQKAYVKQLRESAHPRSVMAYIAHYLSVKNEQTVSYARFTFQMVKRLGELDQQNPLLALIFYHTVGEVPDDPQAIATLLSLGQVGSIIDYYESFLSVAAMVAVRDYNGTQSHLANAIKSIQGHLVDPRLVSLAFLTGISESAPPVMETSSLLAMLSEQHSEVPRILASNSELTQSGFDSLELAGRSAAALEAPAGQGATLADALVERIAATLRVQASREDSEDEMLKMASTYHGQPWADGLRAFIEDQHRPVGVAAEGLYSGLTLLSPQWHPLRLKYLSRPYIDRCRAFWEGVLAENPVVTDYCRMLASGATTAQLVDHLGVHEKAIALGESALLDQRAAEGLEATEVVDQGTDYYRFRIRAIRATSLLRLGRLAECVHIVVDDILENLETHRSLPLAEVADKLRDNNVVPPSLPIPVLLDLSTRLIGAEYDGPRRDAFENFMAVSGVKLPSQLEGVPGLNHDQLVYFLRFVCVPAVLRTSLLCRSTDAVIQERLAVCRVLIRLDEFNHDTYEGEIKEILRDVSLGKRLTQIDRSKLYVDLDGIQRKARDTLSESFARYSAFVKHGLNTVELGAIAAAIERAKRGESSAITELALPQNEATELLLSIVEELRDLFVASPEYGLDRSLSMRIRHGTLVAELRSPLQKQHLVTQRDSTTLKYIPNEYWSDRLSIGDPGVRKAVAARLETFTRSFDELVDELVKKWLKIKKGPDGVGLFDFSISPEGVRVLGELIDFETTFDEFMTVVLGSYMSILDSHLAIVRESLTTGPKARLRVLLTNLQTDLHRICKGTNIVRLDDSIGAARTDILNAFDRVIEWFRLWKATPSEPFVLDDAIEVSSKTAKLLHPSFEADYTVENEELIVQLSGLYFMNVVDILYNLFANVALHSGHEEPCAQVTVTYETDRITIRVENDVTPEEVQKGMEKVGRIKRAMSDKDYAESVVTEGETGFYKICKILSPDDSSVPDLDFGYLDGRRFYAQFRLNLKDLPQ
jgi:hypothetical protein